MMHEIIKAHVRIPDVLPDERDLSAYKRLAVSVILFAFNDAQKTSGDDYINARRFLRRQLVAAPLVPLAERPPGLDPSGGWE
jgi:hypothetical protein